MKFYSDNSELKGFLKNILIFGLTFLTTTAIPLFILVYLIRLGDALYLITLNLKLITMVAIILGSIITVLTILALSLNPLSKYAFIASVGAEVLYCIYILVWSRMGSIYINTEEFLMSFDLSGLYLIILPVPVLIIIKTTINYKNKNKESINIALILDIIKKGNFNSLFQIKRVIRKELNTDMDLRKDLLNNIEYYMKILQKGNFPLVEKTNKFKITKKGYNYLKRIKEHKKMKSKMYLKKKEDRPVLEVWTEKELEKLIKKKRSDS
ncbi:hypothetical protein ES703_09301 [subsurface metagenome]